MYRLPVSMRAELARPLAPPRTTEEALPLVRGKRLIVVGDYSSERFLEHGVTPDVMLVDGKTKRTTDFSAFKESLAERVGAERVEVENPPAAITPALWDAIERAVRAPGRTVIEVDGEEDLAALPCILLAPEGSVVAYGQPDEGVVIVNVDAGSRERARDLLNRMETLP